MFFKCAKTKSGEYVGDAILWKGNSSQTEKLDWDKRFKKLGMKISC